MEKGRPVLLVGTAAMGAAYVPVLRDGLSREVIACGRDPGRTDDFAATLGAVDAVTVDSLDSRRVANAAYVVVATAVESLEAVVGRLLDLGARAILVEKPGALDASAGRRVAERVRRAGAVVRVAYNRRCFGSIAALRRLLAEEPAVVASFDFTEWTARVLSAGKDPRVMARLAVANSVHVIDTVAHLLGPITELDAHTAGAGELEWHPASSAFWGSARFGPTPTTWSTSWVSPGRWSIEVRTRSGLYRLSPMEELTVQRHESTAWEPVSEAVDVADERFKPGVLRVVEEFERALEGEAGVLPDLDENADLLESVERIAGYRE